MHARMHMKTRSARRCTSSARGCERITNLVQEGRKNRTHAKLVDENGQDVQNAGNDLEDVAEAHETVVAGVRVNAILIHNPHSIEG